MIDLRSDTVTKPTPAMLEFMCRAKVGDDVFAEDPTVNELQAYAAEMFGMEAGLFCPSGTMTNQIAIKAHTQPGDEVICEAGAHIHYYEGGGIAFNSGATTMPLVGDRGIITADQIEDALRPKNVHFPRTSLVCLENTCNRGGGKIFHFEEIKHIRTICHEKGLKLHLDGARLFNALVEEKRDPKDIGSQFDSVSICLSKGLGAPVGSILLGSAKLIDKAVRIRKVLGGGMRQAGFMAAAGLYALQHHVNRLKDDHALAKATEVALNEQDYVKQVQKVETNIVVFELQGHIATDDFLKHLASENILAFEVGKQRVRFVTHLDLPPDCLFKVKSALESYSS